MALKINGKVIETGKLWSEYTEEEKKVLPPLKTPNKKHCRLGYNGDWYLDEEMEYDD